MKILELAPGIEFVDLALHLPKHQTLIVADIHLGLEAELIKAGTLVPRTHFKDLKARLLRTFEFLDISSTKPYQRIVVNGDLSHQFGYLSFRELEESSILLKLLKEYFDEVILIEGNHDGSLKPLHSHSDKILIGGSYALDRQLFIHGDSEPSEIPEGIDTIVIGHEHPAVGLRDRVTGRVEQFKCFLLGTYKKCRLIVLPSLNPLSSGTDLTKEQVLSPLLNEDTLGEFLVYAVADEGFCLNFGPLSGLLSEEEVAGTPNVPDRD